LQQVDDSGGDDSSVGTDDTTVNNDDSELQQQLLQQQQDRDEAQLSENNAIQSMIQSEQQAQEQNVKCPGSDGGSGYWISTRGWSVRFVA
jgi:hypothetical protein